MAALYQYYSLGLSQKLAPWENLDRDETKNHKGADKATESGGNGH